MDLDDCDVPQHEEFYFPGTIPFLAFKAALNTSDPVQRIRQGAYKRTR